MAHTVSPAIEFLPVGTILLQRSAHDGRLCDALQTLSGTGKHMTEKEAEAYINRMFSISYDRSPNKTKRAAKNARKERDGVFDDYTGPDKSVKVRTYSNKVLGGVSFEYCENCGGVTNCRLATGQLIENVDLEDAAMRYHGVANDAGCVC